MNLPSKIVALLCVMLTIGAPDQWAQSPNATRSYAEATSPGNAQGLVPANQGAAALWQSLKKLHTRASLLMVTAHPDDEDGPLLTYESRGAGARVALLTLTRGEGGANVMSPDLDDALGLLRTQELLAADRHYGVEQYWSTVSDYGFSKTAAEAFQKWGHDRALSDVVRIVRTVRPLVMSTVFTGSVSDGHGNHQAAGILAKEAFEAAADATKFPEQIQQGLRPWKPLKLYVRNAGSKNEKTKADDLTAPVNTYEPLFGMSCAQLARQGLGEQKSQNGGSYIPFITRFAGGYRKAGAAAQSKSQEQTMFDGIDTSLAGIATLGREPGKSFLPEAVNFLPEGLRNVNAAVEEATASFNATQLERSAPALAEGLKQTQELSQRVQESRISEGNKKDILHELAVKQAQFNNALALALGLTMEAVVVPAQEENTRRQEFTGPANTFEMAVPGQVFNVRASVLNRGAEPVELAALSLDSPQRDAWTFAATKEASGAMNEGDLMEGRFRATVSQSATPTRPYFSRPSSDQPFYDITNQQQFGSSNTPYPLEAWAEVKYEGARIRLGKTVQTVRHVNGAGTTLTPLVIGPAISLSVAPQATVFPITAKSIPVLVQVHSNAAAKAEGSVRLELPAGWRAEPASAPFSIPDSNSDVSLSFRVTPAAAKEQAYSVFAIAQYGGREYREGYQTIGYPGLRPSYLYRPSQASLKAADVKVAPKLKVAYVMGSGDQVPESLASLGINPTLLSDGDLARGELQAYDVILLGVRAYAARPELVRSNNRLMQYVENGGVLIVQYNTPEFDHNFGPYRYKMGNNPEEVTDEASSITILSPENPVFSGPNKVSEEDFKGWSEERGSKFLTSWDENYEALLSTADEGQAEQKGGLLYAKYGKGLYVYCAYALYRQLPAGVPGAYRLMANLISLPASLTNQPARPRRNTPGRKITPKAPATKGADQ